MALYAIGAIGGREAKAEIAEAIGARAHSGVDTAAAQNPLVPLDYLLASKVVSERTAAAALTHVIVDMEQFSLLPACSHPFFLSIVRSLVRYLAQKICFQPLSSWSRMYCANVL